MSQDVQLANMANLLRFKTYAAGSIADTPTYLGICHQSISNSINEQMPELVRR